ncbi:MAG: ligase-associated DNA damage response endonuclease PdeM [Yoonia sp.]|nr:ligase-associated DNA damage response endonuclease PdeM [Yoonia sp.]
MTDHAFTFSDVSLVATARRALWLPDTQTLCVSDLHLGKSGRIARRTGTMLPPFETTDTLARLEDEINRFDPKSVICLGDSFDDLDASKELSPQAAATFAQLQAGRRWIWIEGNHDPGPIEIGGSHHDAFQIRGLAFRHIATKATGEVSGHYHPKHGLRGSGPARPCFLYDHDRLIMPAFGTYTGGLSSLAEPLTNLFPNGAIAVMTGKTAIPVPVTRTLRKPRSVGRSY